MPLIQARRVAVEKRDREHTTKVFLGMLSPRQAWAEFPCDVHQTKTLSDIAYLS